MCVTAFNFASFSASVRALYISTILFFLSIPLPTASPSSSSSLASLVFRRGVLLPAMASQLSRWHNRFHRRGRQKGGGGGGIYFGGGGVIKRPNSPSHLFVSDDFPGVDHQLSYNTVKDSTFVRVSNFLKSKTGSKYNLQCRRVELQVLSPPVHLSAVRKSHITPNHPLASFDLYAHEITMGIPNQKVGFGQVSHSRMKKRNQDR